MKQLAQNSIRAEINCGCKSAEDHVNNDLAILLCKLNTSEYQGLNSNSDMSEIVTGFHLFFPSENFLKKVFLELSKTFEKSC